MNTCLCCLSQAAPSGLVGVQTVVRWRSLYAVLLACLLYSLPASAAPDYQALLIRTLQPLEHIRLEKAVINGRDMLVRLPAPAGAAAASAQPPGSLTQSEYKKLPNFPFAEIYSFRVVGGRLQVRTRLRTELWALPANLKTWPGGTVEPGAVTRASSLTGRELPARKNFTAPLQEGWVVYLFTAPPSEDTIAFSLAEAQNRQEVWEDFLRRFATSPHVTSAREYLAAMYVARARQALSKFHDALREKKLGYAFLGEARQWFDRVVPLNIQSSAVAETRAAITQLETQLADTLRQARQLAEQADFAGAERTLEPLLHFRDEFPELAAALEDIKTLAALHHRNLARQRLAQNRFDDAVRELETTASFKALPELPALRQEIEVQRAAFLRRQDIEQTQARARDAATRNDLATAFEHLAALSQRYSDDAKVQEGFTALRQNYRAALLTQVPEVERLYTPIRGPADEEVLLELHGRLARLADFDSSPELAVWRDRISTHLADYYRQRATQLAQQTTPELSPLAFAYLQQAYHFALDKATLTEFPAWRDRLERQLRIRIALEFRDVTPEAGGQYIVADLLTQFGAAIQKSGLPRVEILEARRPEGDPPILEFFVELLQAGVQDSSVPEPTKSDYSAGFRQVPNPQWRDAKADYDRAQEAYEQLRTRIEQARRRRKPSKKEEQANTQALAAAEAALKQAKEKLDALPAFIDEEDIRPYEFTRRTLIRTASMRLAYRWVNARTGVREAQQILEGSEEAREVEVTGVHAADKRGHRNQPANLPDAATMRGRVLRKIQQQLAEQAIAYLKSFIERDLERARQKATRGEHEGAAEDYIRFLFNSPADDPRRQQALDYLKKEFRLVALADWLVLARQPF